MKKRSVLRLEEEFRLKWRNASRTTAIIAGDFTNRFVSDIRVSGASGDLDDFGCDAMSIMAWLMLRIPLPPGWLVQAVTPPPWLPGTGSTPRNKRAVLTPAKAKARMPAFGGNAGGECQRTARLRAN
jgi:hypothetical protein